MRSRPIRCMNRLLFGSVLKTGSINIYNFTSKRDIDYEGPFGRFAAHDAMHNRGPCRRALSFCLSVRLAVCPVRVLC